MKTENVLTISVEVDTEEAIKIISEQIEFQINDIRKETAREILQSLVGHTFSDDGWTWTVSKDDIKFFAEKYGVEVEE